MVRMLRIGKIRATLGLTLLLVPSIAVLGDEQEAAPSPLEEAQALVKQGKYADAEARARALLSDLESRDQEESAEAAAVLDLLVESLWRGGKVREEETGSLAERALAVNEAVFGKDHLEVAEPLNNLAVIDFFLGNLGQAETRWKRALAIRTEGLGPRHPDVAQMMNNLGNLYVKTGDFGAARPMYEEALSIRIEALGEDSSLVGQSYNNLSTLLSEMGDYAGALPMAERCLAIYEKVLPAGHPRIAQSLNTLAHVLLETGESERALGMLEQVETIQEKAAGPEHPSLGAFINNHADELRKLGRLEEAEPLYERALAILEKAYGSDHPHVAGCLGGMGALAEAEGDIPRAIELQKRVIAIKEKIMDPGHPRLALSLTDLGRLYLESGDLDQAAPMLERSVHIRRAALGGDHPDVADSLIELASARAARGNTGDALSEALESESISREHLRLTGRSLSERHALSYAASRERGLDLALSLAASGRLDPAARREVFDSLIRSRGIVLDGIAARHRTALSTGDPEIERLAGDLATARTRLANMTVRGLGDLDPAAYRELLDQAREAKESAERALAAASVEFAAEQERGRLGLSDTESHLKPGTAVVSFVLYRDMTSNPATREPVPSYIAFVLNAGNKEPKAVSLGPSSRLEDLVTAWKAEAAGRTLLQAPSRAATEYLRVGTALREAMWDPVAKHLTEARRVFIVPDGALNLVSVAALPTGENSYLIEKGPLMQYLSAERDIVPAAGDAATGHGLLALGAPDYDEAVILAADRRPDKGGSGGMRMRSSLRSACGGFDSLEFEPLPAAAQEAERVVAQWRDAMSSGKVKNEPLYLTGAGASEAAFKQAVRGRRLLHLATHGFFLNGECLAGSGSTRGMGGVAAGTPAAPKKEAGSPAPASTVDMQRGENPLLLSGLALAGANSRSVADGAEDGILTAEEIASLDLSGVELAVLSACDTGVGEIRAGEGVFGLRRAMQVAGVRSLILSLWSVDDEATRNWMTALYDGLLDEGLDPAEAARAAGLRVLRSRRDRGENAHPFFWAAFVAAGV